MKLLALAATIRLLYLGSVLHNVAAQFGWPQPGGGGGGFPDYGGGSYCGSTQITIPSNGRVQNLTSVDFPYNYANQLDCKYYIYTSYGKKIYMNIAFFQIERDYDTLKIGKGSDPYYAGSLLAELTGTQVRLKRLWTPSYTAWLEFTTDQTRTMQGYIISLQTVSQRGQCVGDREVKCDNHFCIDYRGRCDGYNDCGDNSDESDVCTRCPSNNMVSLSETGTQKKIWTPGYPNRYPSNVKCFWYINSTIPNSRISAYVEDFSLESSYDWWTAGMGDNNKDSRTLLAKLSGDLQITRVMSPTNKMWIEFKSDNRINKAGFWLYVQPIAGKDNCTDYGDYFQCDNDFCVKSKATCNGYNDCLDNSDETKCETINCGEGRYWCEGDHYCIFVDYICDGIQHCTYNHDELNCDKQKCPDGCDCFYRSDVLENGITEEVLVISCSVGWDYRNFNRYPQQIDTMRLSGADISTIPSNAVFRNFTLMKYLSLVNNDITKIEGGAFMGLVSLIWLDLSNNRFSRIESGAFLGLGNLEVLLMYNIPLTQVDAKGLDGLNSLKVWFLQRNLPKTKSVDLGGYTYDARTGYTYGDPTYTGVKGIDNLYVDDYRLCCYLRFVRAKTCQSTKKTPQFFDCGDLLKHDALKICLWLINLVGIVANILTIEIRYRNYNRIGRLFIPTFMFGNLAVSGILMGVYSLMMGFIDLSNTNSGSFFINSDQWRESVRCKAAGSVSLISVQSLVFILTLMAVERFIKVMYPDSKYVMSARAAKVSMIFIWTLSIILGIGIPFLSGRGAYGWTDNCLGLPLHRLNGEYVETSINLRSPAGGYEIMLPRPDPHRERNAWPLSIALFLVIDPICLITALVLFLIVKYKGVHEELPFDEDDFDDEKNDIKQKPVVIDVDFKGAGGEKNSEGSTAAVESADETGGIRAVPNQYEEIPTPSAPPMLVYETLGDAKTEVAKSDDDDDDSIPGEVVGGTTAEEIAKFKPNAEASLTRKMTKKKSSGKKVRVLKGSKAKKKSLSKKKSSAPGDQIVTITDGVILSHEEQTTLKGVSIKKPDEDDTNKFMTLEGADFGAVDIEAAHIDGERKKRKRRRRKKKVPSEGDEALEKAEGGEKGQLDEEKAEGVDKDEEGEGTGSEWETDTSASDVSSSDGEPEIEIEERKITSKYLATKMMRVFIFDVIALSPLFLVGILAQADVVDIPIEFTYWAALFIIPFLFCLNPFVICCVDIGGIRPKYEWQFDEVSYSETLSEKRERIAREALTFL